MSKRHGSGFLWALLPLAIGGALIAKGGRAHHRGIAGRGSGGPWAGREVPPRVEQMLKSWHERAHSQVAATEPQPAADEVEK